MSYRGWGKQGEQQHILLHWFLTWVSLLVFNSVHAFIYVLGSPGILPFLGCLFLEFLVIIQPAEATPHWAVLSWYQCPFRSALNENHQGKKKSSSFSETKLRINSTRSSTSLFTAESLKQKGCIGIWSVVNKLPWSLYFEISGLLFWGKNDHLPCSQTKAFSSTQGIPNVENELEIGF